MSTLKHKVIQGMPVTFECEDYNKRCVNVCAIPEQFYEEFSEPEPLLAVIINKKTGKTSIHINSGIPTDYEIDVENPDAFKAEVISIAKKKAKKMAKKKK